MPNIANMSYANQKLTYQEMKGNTYVTCDFRGATLPTLEGVHFIDCKFDVSTKFPHGIKQVSFSQCDMGGASFGNALIEKTLFWGKKGTEPCSLDFCSIESASFFGVTGYSFMYATITESVFEDIADCTFDSALMEHVTMKGSLSNLRLVGVNSDSAGVIFDEASVHGGKFSVIGKSLSIRDCALKGVNFGNTQVEYLDFEGKVSFDGTSFEGASVDNLRFYGRSKDAFQVSDNNNFKFARVGEMLRVPPEIKWRMNPKEYVPPTDSTKGNTSKIAATKNEYDKDERGTPQAVKGVNYAGKDFDDADISNNHYTECDFSGTLLSGVNMRNTRFTECTFDADTKMPDTMYGIVFEDCKYNRMQFGKNMSNCHFNGTVVDAVFTGCNLSITFNDDVRSCTFRDALIDKSDFLGATQYSIFNGALIRDVLFKSFLSHCDFIMTDFKNVTFKSSFNLSNVTAINLSEITFNKGYLYGVDFSDSNFGKFNISTERFVSKINMEGATILGGYLSPNIKWADDNNLNVNKSGMVFKPMEKNGKLYYKLATV